MIDEDTLALIEDALDHFHHYWGVFLQVGVCPTRFSLPWQHSLSHYYHLICLFGVPNGLCSSITKSKHSKAVKKPFQCSNQCNALGQMLVTNQQLDQIAAVHSDFKGQGILKGMVLTDALEGAESLGEFC
jgi:hypothetical protein